MQRKALVALRAEALLDEQALSVTWSRCGQYLAALPSEGRIAVLEPQSSITAHLPPHRGGNGSSVWHPYRPILATYGQDGFIHLYQPPFTTAFRSFETRVRGWAERLAWNPDGTLLAVGAGRSVVVLDASNGEVRAQFPNHKSTISDLVWNPAATDELAVVCDGGLRLWRIGTQEEFGFFDWGGASLSVSWSPDARWVVTGDHTPGVHLYEVATEIPLHIQGFESKVKAMAWQGRGEWLAVAGGRLITVWPCAGKRGPDGATPVQLDAHEGEVTALDFVGDGGILFSAGRDGLVLLWKTHESDQPALLLENPHGLTSIALSPIMNSFATGDEAGNIAIWDLTAKSKSQNNSEI